MRIDKYLWSVRYYKTRSIATQACKKGAVRINDAAVKPSRDVYPGDNVTLRKNQINYSLRVLEVPKSRVGPKLVDLYRVDTTPKEAFQQQELLKYSKEYYRKRGMGRPTKKDRRDIEDYIKEEE
jgi:ribosome-associated heat shock protein Hsp15